MQNLKDLELLIKSPTPIIIIESREEGRVMSLFDHVASRTRKPLYRWTVTEGLQRLDVNEPANLYESKPVELLTQIKLTSSGGIYLLLDFHPYLDDPIHVRLLKDIAQRYVDVPHTLVLISIELNVPKELERYCARFELSLPDRTQLESIIRREAKAWSTINNNLRIVVEKRVLNQLVESLLGLPLDDVRHLVRGAIRDNNVLTESEVAEVMKAKFDLLNQGGVLSFEYDTAHYADVGGLNKLKEWLILRKTSFTGELRKPGLDAPKGIMLLGVQGCGKSLAAKAVAGAWGVPLLRLDFGSIYNKYHGESEKNLRESLKTAEIMAPCILWVDEIEKGISVADSDGGTSRRILGTLLTWMAEKKEKVFIVATANDIESLPPELIRKGRLDEIFFVDLPDKDTREIIFSIHLKKRELDVEDFDLASLADKSEGFSGSEIEQAVVSALYSAHAKNARLDDSHLLEELAKTRPLSVVMAERIQYLKDWARDRTVMAN
ncbi:MAG: AAA family ATPase [Gammaproteobacteria bacterium]|nr:AAA family ATPase [Gammaproteobacteria bacterium]